MTFSPVLTPYPHQVEALVKMEGRRAFALLMEMRTGKTKVIVDDWGRMEAAGEVRDLLYLSPGGALYGEDALETQLPQHMPAELRDRARMAVWRSGSPKSKREVEALLATKDPRRPRVLLMNVEALSTGSTGAFEVCHTLLGSKRAVMVVGESTCIKGSSRRTEQVEALSELAPYRRIETGLVAPHSPLDLFHQFYFLDPAILRARSWWGFRARYAVMREVCFLPAAAREDLIKRFGRLPKNAITKIVVAYRNEDELRGLIEPHSYRKKFRDCAKAPPGTYLFRDVSMSPEQARMYKEFKAHATTRIAGADAHMTAEVALTQIIRLHQLVCGYVVDDEGGGIHDVPERRTSALLDILEECQGQAVIWCGYNHNIVKVSEAIRRRFDQTGTPAERSCVARFWGGNASTRVEEERRFKAGDAQFMVANQAAGGKGREWSCASLMVYFSNTMNLEHRDQSEMRIEAVNKLDPVTRIDLRVPDSVDDLAIKNLRAKIDIASTLQGDGYRQWLI